MRSPLRVIALPLSTVCATLTAIVLGSGCIIVSRPPPDDRPGDVTFTWDFDGRDRCGDADVTEVDVVVERADGSTELSTTVSCEGEGLTLEDLEPGTVEILLDAYDRDDVRRYSGRRTVSVEPGVVTDIGRFAMDEVAPPVQVGSVQLTWLFHYPTAQSMETDCVRAGAEEIDVDIVPTAGNSSGMTYQETFRCDAEGVNVSSLPAGEYTLRLRAYGTYMNDDILLYDTGDVALTIEADFTRNLGDVGLSQEPNSFADIDVNWVLTGSCVDLGLSDIDFTVTRVDADLVDDTFTVACDAPSTMVRNNFVPGSYLVEATAIATGGVNFYGSRTVNVEPGMTTAIDVDVVQE